METVLGERGRGWRSRGAAINLTEWGRGRYLVFWNQSSLNESFRSSPSYRRKPVSRSLSNSWIPARATPDSDPGLAGMTPELFSELRSHHTRVQFYGEQYKELRRCSFKGYDSAHLLRNVERKRELSVSELNDLKKKLAMSSRMLFNAQLVNYSGHISARIPGSDHFLILPHPVSRATVAADDMVVADFDGKSVEGKYKAPSEVFMHARAYKARGDIESVAHLHNHMVATLSMVDKPFYPASSNPGAFFGPGPMPVYIDPALIHTIEQGDAVARPLGKGDAVMLRGHGSMVVGQTIAWDFAAVVRH